MVPSIQLVLTYLGKRDVGAWSVSSGLELGSVRVQARRGVWNNSPVRESLSSS